MTPTTLYKYRPDGPRTEEIITSRKIWLSPADQLNDPLECKTGVIPEDWKRLTIRKMEDAQLMGVVGLPGRPSETLFSYDRQRTRKWIKRFLKLPHGRRIREMRTLYSEHGITRSDPTKIFDTLQAQLSSIGIFSLSECADNQPMWAHYATNHSGLALGFAVRSGNKLADQRHTLRVTYDERKPTFEAGFLQQVTVHKVRGGFSSEARFSFDDPVLRSSISTKPPSWSYEREWRYIEETSGLFDFPGDLVSAVFGYRMPQNRRDHYTALLEQSGFRIERLEARTSPEGKFKIARLT